MRPLGRSRKLDRLNSRSMAINIGQINKLDQHRNKSCLIAVALSAIGSSPSRIAAHSSFQLPSRPGPCSRRTPARLPILSSLHSLCQSRYRSRSRTSSGRFKPVSIGNYELLLCITQKCYSKLVSAETDFERFLRTARAIPSFPDLCRDIQFKFNTINNSN